MTHSWILNTWYINSNTTLSTEFTKEKYHKMEPTSLSTAKKSEYLRKKTQLQLNGVKLEPPLSANPPVYSLPKRKPKLISLEEPKKSFFLLLLKMIHLPSFSESTIKNIKVLKILSPMPHAPQTVSLLSSRY